MLNLEKINQLKEKLNENNVDALLILSRNNSDKTLPLFIDVKVCKQTAFLLDKNGEVLVISCEKELEKYTNVKSIVENNNIYLKVWSLLQQKNIKKFALNVSENDYLLDGLTYGQYLGLEEVIGKEKFESMYVSSENIVGDLRAIKSKSEIEKIKKAVDITISIYKDVKEQIKIGMSETQIADLFVEGMKKNNVVNALGKDDYSYPLVMVNRCGLAHREPSSNYILEEGDILVCDFSIKYEGYCSDIARGFYALKKGEEKAPQDVQKAFDTAVLAVSNMIDNMKEGLKGYEVDWLGREVIEKGGYPTIRHSAGHQLGKSVHDGGTPLSPYDKNKPKTTNKLRCNEVYAIEPTVIQDNGLPSFIVEENVVVKENSVEVLSERQLELWLVK